MEIRGGGVGGEAPAEVVALDAAAAGEGGLAGFEGQPARTLARQASAMAAGVAAGAAPAGGAGGGRPWRAAQESR